MPPHCVCVCSNVAVIVDAVAAAGAIEQFHCDGKHICEKQEQK